MRGKKSNKAIKNRKNVEVIKSSAFNLRLMAAEILNDILFKGKKLKTLIEEKQGIFQKESDRALLKEIVYGSLRQIPFLDFAIENFAERSLSETEPIILSILRIGAYQIFFLEKIPFYAAVNECVEATKIPGFKKAAGFVNSILRKIAEKKEELFSLSYSKPFPDSLAIKYGMPLWIVKRYIKIFGEEEAEKILESYNTPSKNSIVFTSVKDFVASQCYLKNLILEKNEIFDLTFWVKNGNVSQNEAFNKGLFYICDPASQIPSIALPVKENSFSLDCCAAPGTKTILILKKLPPNSFLFSSDFSKGRLKQLRENKERYSLENVYIVAGDMVNGFCFKEKFFSVLLDAPCSSMGTLKKNPEIRWQISEERIIRESQRQIEMLKKAAETVCKGGFLLYSVCSIEKEETLDVIEQFLTENKEFSKGKLEIDEKIKKAFTMIEDFSIISKPYQHRGDGFFVALLRKKNG